MRTKNCLNKTKKYNLQVFNSYNHLILNVDLTTYAEIVALCPIFKTEDAVRDYLRLKGEFKQKGKA